MSILIKGMDMPVEGLVTVNIHSDGTVYVHGAYPTELHEAVSIPTPHGRLKDVDWTREEIDKDRPGRMYEDAWALTVMDNAPTIIEAEEGADHD